MSIDNRVRVNVASVNYIKLRKPEYDLDVFPCLN